MHILFIINSLESKGGTERVASLLANWLSSFHELTILSKYFDGRKNAYWLDKSVNDIKLIGNDFTFISKCKQHILQSNPDLIIIHTMSKLTPVLLLRDIKANNIWSLEHISYNFHSCLFRYLRQKLYRKLDKVITLTHEDAKNYDFVSDKLSVIANSNSLPIRKSVNSLDSKIVVSIGRLTYQKGYDLLIKSWALVEKKHPDWSLHIYGEGKDEGNLKRLISNYKLKNVVFKGLTSSVQAAYDEAAFYVMSSRFEGFGMVLIEAQSRGLPIVSFDCPSGPAEIISEGIDGYLVENGNVKMLAERIAYLIDNGSMRQVLSANALISAKRFEPEQIINQWITLIDDECKRND